MSKGVLVYKVSKTGKGNISVKIVADSIDKNNNRITTFELDYHRYVHAELMTHRMFSRNAASSRAIPIKAAVANVLDNPANPIFWAKNQAGMQSHNEHDTLVNFNGNEYTPSALWNHLKEYNTNATLAYGEADYHKQIPNRLIEPYQMIKVIVTATSFDNFFNLRFESLSGFQAQHEIHELGKLMYYAYEQSTPVLLGEYDWHTPYYKTGVWKSSETYNIDAALYSIIENRIKDLSGIVDADGVSLIDALRISSSCCAQVSYRKLNDSVEKAIDIYNKLVMSDPVHASALEHCATPITTESHEHSIQWQSGVTHMKRDGTMCSGNFDNFIQYRQLIKHNVCCEFSLED